ncbi:MAG: hypothetical protein LBO77_03425, partial [Desulfovibrio sp.]|nr:hypothetical protein [Desulfovibrio sp.]
MHHCAMLLGEVLALTSLEEEALVLEDLDQAEDLACKRSELLRQAWKEREGYDRDLLRNTLMVIEAMQSRLMDIAGSLRQDLGLRLRQTRQQGKYFAGNRHLVRQSQKARHCD